MIKLSLLPLNRAFEILENLIYQAFILLIWPYGVNFEGKTSNDITFNGDLDPEELVNVLQGSFCLVWDGNDITSCTGVYGEYFKINNPHKTLLYIAAGFPVIIWSGAALKDFIVNNGLGIAIDSLEELNEENSNISEYEYKVMCENTQKIGELIRSGHYLKTAVGKCCDIFDSELI